MKKKIKIKKKVKVIIYCFILLLIIFIYTMFNSNIFDLKQIVLQGNRIITEKEIIKMTSIEFNKNIFKYKIDELEDTIQNNPYVKKVNVKREFPNKIYIAIEENTEDAIIEYNQNYIYIHRDGKILSQKKNITNEDIPLIKEVNLQECIVGEYIKLKNKSDKNMLLELLKSLINNNLIRDIYNIELKKEYVIMKNKDDIDIVLNLDDEITYNINRLVQIMVDLKSKGIKNGKVDLTNKSQAIYSPT